MKKIVALIAVLVVAAAASISIYALGAGTKETGAEQTAEIDSASSMEESSPAVDSEAAAGTGTAERWGVESDQIATILLPLAENVTITNDRGETLTVKGGEFSGDMKVYYWNFITGTSPLAAYVVVPVSETYKIETPEDQTPAAFRVADKYRYQLIDGFSGTAALHSDGSMELNGNLQDLEIECLRTGDANVQSLKGVGSETVEIYFEGGKLNASGMEGTYVVGWTDETGTERTDKIGPAFSVKKSNQTTKS